MTKKEKYLNFEVTKRNVIINDVIIIPTEVFEKMILAYNESKASKEDKK